MSRKKSTKVAKLAVDTFSKTLEALESIFKIGPDAFGLFQGKPFEYWEGWINHAFISCSNILMSENCYYGYEYVDSGGDTLPGGAYVCLNFNPEYYPWRVRFFIR